MAKVLDKITKKKKSKKTSRITDSNIEEKREEVLARGKKFKYPFQYAKHKLIINTIVISVAAVLLAVLLGWLELYKFQNTGDVVYRLTRVLPVAVAEVDGGQVRYSDYLMLYRSSIKAIESQQGILTDSEEDKQLKNQYKVEAMDRAVAYGYALKLANELGVEVTDQELNDALKDHRTIDGVERSEEAFAGIIWDNFGLSLDEYKRMLYLSLVKKDVAMTLDEEAVSLKDEVIALLGEGSTDLQTIANTLGDAVLYTETGGMVEEMNLDGGRAQVAAGLEVGEVSEAFVSKNGDGYYFVKLLEKGDGQVNYASIWIPFNVFDSELNQLKADGKVKLYIDLEGWVEQSDV